MYCHEKWNGLSGNAENLDKIGFKVPFAISSADKDSEDFEQVSNRTHMKNL